MKYIGKIKLNGKVYNCEIINGVEYINGKTIDEFIGTIDLISLIDCLKIGLQFRKDLIDKKKEKPYQKIANELYEERNN